MSDAEAQILAALLEAENCSPEDADFALIGRITLNAGSLEYQIEDLIWYYMGDVDLGHVATTPLGAQQKTDMLASLVECTEPDDGVFNAITYVIQAFHVCRLNRNTIAHAYNFKADKRAGTLAMERRTKSLIFDSFEVFDIDRQALVDVLEDQQAVALFIWKLGIMIKRRPVGLIRPNSPPPAQLLQLPPTPPLPKRLTPLRFEAAKSARRQRQELRAKEAKAALVVQRRKKQSPR